MIFLSNFAAKFLLACGGGEPVQLQSLESRAVICSQTEPFDCFVPHCPYQGHGAELEMRKWKWLSTSISPQNNTFNIQQQKVCTGVALTAWVCVDTLDKWNVHCHIPQLPHFSVQSKVHCSVWTLATTFMDFGHLTICSRSPYQPGKHIIVFPGKSSYEALQHFGQCLVPERWYFWVGP